MRIRLPKRRRWRALIYIVSLVLILLAIDLVLMQLGRRIPVRYETTRITEPRMAGGPIDYLAALENHYSAGVTHDNNAAVPLLEALGRTALAANQPRDGITSRLGMPPLPETGDYFQPRDKFPADAKADDETALLAGPWKASEHPGAAAWLSANEKPLAKILEASKRSRFYYPFNAGYRPESAIEVMLPYLASARQANRALVARAMLRIGEKGDYAGARDDLAAVHRFATLLSGAATLVDRLVGYSMDSEASRAEQSLAVTGKLAADDARQSIAAASQLPPIVGVADAIDLGERYLYLDMMQLGARRGVSTFFRAMPDSMRPSGASAAVAYVTPVRWARAMERGNLWYDRVAAAAGIEDRVARRQALRNTMTSSEWPINLFVLAPERIADKEDATVANRVLARVAAALAAHRAQHGRYPETLSGLAPTYLPTVPDDPFTNKPLIYGPTRDGYVLSSAGAAVKPAAATGESNPFLDALTNRLPTGDLTVVAGDAAQPTSKPVPK